MKFVSFHTHTTYSYGDGYGTVKEHVQRVADLGMSALALSEHGNVNSHAALEREAKEAGIKPIYGIEAYLGPIGESRTQAKTHIGLWAINDEGYHNLNRLVTQSWIQHHYFPTIHPNDLRKYNAGLVAFSGCSDSLISCTLLGGKFLGERREPESITDSDTDRVRRKLLWFRDVFAGDNRYFLEVQRFPELKRTRMLNEMFAKLSKDTGIPLIATADVHYPRPTDNTMQALLHAARWRNRDSDFASEAAWEFQANLSYPLDDEEIIDDLTATGLLPEESVAAVQATTDLAALCNVELPKARPLRFKTPPGVDARTELTNAVKKGWRRRVLQRPELMVRKHEYSRRTNEELKVIVDKDFCDYFLVVADLVKWAKDNNVTVGPGRGSAAGSLVCYLLGITEIDPLYPTFSRMVFERFIDPTRSDMPDIDLDFDDELRHLIPERAREIYGQENVCNVANHIKYRGRLALANVAAAYNLPRSFFDDIGRRTDVRVETDDRVDDSIQDVVKSYRTQPAIAALVDQHGDKIVQAEKLEGNEHSMGVHAGGFVISSEPIPKVCAIYTKNSGTGRKASKVQVIPYEKRDAEHLGLLKMDFLGLSTMGMIGKCREWTKMSLDQLYSMFYNQAYDDNDLILKLFKDDDVTGIFQYEGGTTRQVVRDVCPENFDELAACNALSRPGPLYGGQTTEYVKVKRGEKDWERIGKGFDEHVAWTYGQIVYQEQIMWILRDLAGFDTATVLKVRKIIGKKLGEHQFTALWEQFRSGCERNNVDSETALRVWGAITTAAGYAFNTSHAYSYALVAWWQAWFKINYPLEFFAASLAKNGNLKGDIGRRTALLQDAIEHDIILDQDFDPNLMGVNWQPVYDTGEKNLIRPGFCQIPAIGEATAQDIVAWRGRRNAERVSTVGNEVQWWELTQVNGVGEGTIFKMIDWCGQDDPFNIFKVSRELKLFRKQLEDGEFDGSGLPARESFIDSGRLRDNGFVGEQWVAWVGMVSAIHFKDEVEQVRAKSGKTIEEIRASMDEPDKTKKATIFAYDESGEAALRVSRWVYDDLATRIETISENHNIVVAWGRVFEGRGNSIQVRSLWVLDPD